MLRIIFIILDHFSNIVMGKKDYMFLMFSTNALNSELKYFLESKNILWNLNYLGDGGQIFVACEHLSRMK